VPATGDDDDDDKAAALSPPLFFDDEDDDDDEGCGWLLFFWGGGGMLSDNHGAERSRGAAADARPRSKNKKTPEKTRKKTTQRAVHGLLFPEHGPNASFACRLASQAPDHHQPGPVGRRQLAKRLAKVGEHDGGGVAVERLVVER
jgi:hypothetical protein